MFFGSTRFSLNVNLDRKQEDVIKKNHDISMDLRRKGLQIEKYVISRMYRGNAFELVDMIGYDTYEFFINYDETVDSTVRELELKMRA